MVEGWPSRQADVPFAELLRSTVFLTAGGSTALAAVTVIGAQRDFNPTLLIVGAVWWITAAWIGLSMGESERPPNRCGTFSPTRKSVHQDGVTRVARGTRPDRLGATLADPRRGRHGRRYRHRLPGGRGDRSGFALLVALAWRNREAAVLAIERRDGVRFLVEPGSPFKRGEAGPDPGLPGLLRQLIGRCFRPGAFRAGVLSFHQLPVFWTSFGQPGAAGGGDCVVHVRQASRCRASRCSARSSPRLPSAMRAWTSLRSRRCGLPLISSRVPFVGGARSPSRCSAGSPRVCSAGGRWGGRCSRPAGSRSR